MYIDDINELYNVYFVVLNAIDSTFSRSIVTQR